MCSEAPDMSGANQAAVMQANLSKEQLDWVKQIYAETAPDRAATASRAAQVSDAQLASMQQQDSLTRDYNQYQTTTFRPIEQKIAAAAQGFDTPERRETEAAQAMADVGTQADIARSTGLRELAARGVDPSSGSTAVALGRTGITQAAVQAAAGNTARKTVETVGAARLADAANLGRNIASAQGTTASLALNAGNSAIAASRSGLDATTSGVPMVQQGYAGAQQGLSGAANTYLGIAKVQAGDGGAGAAAGIGSAVGGIAMAI